MLDMIRKKAELAAYIGISLLPSHLCFIETKAIYIIEKVLNLSMYRVLIMYPSKVSLLYGNIYTKTFLLLKNFSFL